MAWMSEPARREPCAGDEVHRADPPAKPNVVVADPDFTLLQGDALEVLPTLEAGSVDCCVTSPPYWGLRDYGTGEWSGGDPACEHARPTTNYSVGFNERWGNSPGQQRKQERGSNGQHAHRCPDCGATRSDRQIGLESTPELYVGRLVEVFRQVRRLLRDDGTLWLNIGDSYYGGGQDGSQFGSKKKPVQWSDKANRETVKRGHADPRHGLKFKDLVGIPWLLALALRADGWYLRADIIWAKPNAMPEPVQDRPTKAHEYLFLLAKQGRYFYDTDAVREPHSPDRRSVTTRTVGAGSHDNYGEFGHEEGRERWPNGGRNKRSVWEIATEAYPDAHFATFPQALVEPCLLAGCPEGGVVLDPFIGSGTVALVARRLGRRCLGVELSPVYAALAAERTRQLSLLAAEPVAPVQASEQEVSTA
jgi:site-specific DNA-methyltransferase (cytosine-N4-specific)